jgi:cation:H+ antiporter
LVALLLILFTLSLGGLLISAKFFTNAAEKIGTYLRLSPFVIGVFIIGIGTSLPELISGILSVRQGVSEIVPGNIVGANIANLLLLVGLTAVLNRRPIELQSSYVYIDLHFLIGGVFSFYMISADGKISLAEAAFGGAIFLVYSIYLMKQGSKEVEAGTEPLGQKRSLGLNILVLTLAGIGIYFGAEMTVSTLTRIADAFQIPKSVAAPTILSIGTTLPELAVSAAAIKQGKAELAIGNVLGSAVFNTLAIPCIVTWFGTITVPPSLFVLSLPVLAASSIFFYLLTQDKRISAWEGSLMVLLYGLFMFKIAFG